MLVVHGATDTNDPDSESEQIVEASGLCGCTVRDLLFDDDGHQIVKHENHAALARAVADWLAAASDGRHV